MKLNQWRLLFEAGIREKFVKILKKHDWILIRIKGSHHILTHPDFQEKIIVPVHSNQTLKIGLQTKLMKIANINESEL